MRLFVLFVSGLAALTATRSVLAADLPSGAPPPDAKALVEAPKAPGDVPKAEASSDKTSGTLSAGAQGSTGNSRIFAATANGTFLMRRDAEGFGASLLGNYAESAAPSDPTHHFYLTTQNIQGRLRYDHYFGDRFSLFLSATGRHDKFQGLSFRLNVDPGAKYLFVNDDATSLWGEIGYDFQFDYRLGQDSIYLPVASGGPLNRWVTDHSSRLFVGFRHAFSKDVTLATGIEYLQSFVHSDDPRVRLDDDARLNFDALFAANLGSGFSLGLGFSARYTDHPLPAKTNLDTATTLTLIYSFSSPPPTPPPPPPAPAPCVNPPPSTPAPSTSPAPATPAPETPDSAPGTAPVFRKEL